MTHSGVIGVLVALTLDSPREVRASLPQVALVPLKFSGALAAFLCVYYVSHSLLYGTTIL